MKLLLVCFCMLAAMPFAQAGQDSGPRSRKLLDFGWKFHLGNAADPEQDFSFGLDNGFAKAGEAGGAAAPGFDDSAWRTVNVPHDWVVEGPFVKEGGNLHVQHGFKPVGRAFPDRAIGWYRRQFHIPDTDKGARITVEFDGVFRDSLVWINGHLLGREESGYTSFSYDMTDFVNYGGDNILSVRVDAGNYEGWFYEGAGIYRHVWLTKTSPVHVAHWGTFVRADVGDKSAKVRIQTEVQNESDSAHSVVLRSAIHDAEGKEIGRTDSAATTLQPWSSHTFEQMVDLRSPHLWDLNDPYLYRCDSTVESGSKATDKTSTNFGIRNIRFDKDHGFFLNGKRLEIKGTCNHQDHAGVGSALPDRLQYYRIERLKEMGSNAYRTSHNAPTPELLDACDRLGMLVMDENRLLDGSDMVLTQLRSLICRDRNHPCVILWSLGNEEYEGSSPRGQRIAETMKRTVRDLDPTRPTTYAGNNGNDFEGVNAVVDVRGWNYMAQGNMDDYHKDHPAQPMVGSEEASTLSTRGEYRKDEAKGYMPSYDTGKPGWGSTAEEWVTFYAARPHLAGAFVWTGFDYRGEPTPYEWPCINSHFGIMDTCGFPKDNFFYYQSVWGGQDMVHILPHWTWPGREGQDVDIWVYTNLEEVELFQDGNSLGRKKMTPNLHLEWKVPYRSGSLEARGYRGGQIVKTETVTTAGSPAKIVLTPDRTVISAGQEDVSVVNVSVVDDKGSVVPYAANEIAFEIKGGQIIGVGNGDPSCHEPDKYISSVRRAPFGPWRMHHVPTVEDTAPTKPGLDDSKWETTQVSGQGYQIKEQDTVYAFRSTFEIESVSKSSDLRLGIGQADDESWVYVNGQKVGETHVWNKSYSFDVTPFVHQGKNSIAIIVHNKGGWGGLGHGVSVSEFVPAERYRRSVFHGLAQAIVQSGKEPGFIHVSATAPGLTSGEADIKVDPGTGRGY